MLNINYLLLEYLLAGFLDKLYLIICLEGVDGKLNLQGNRRLKDPCLYKENSP